MRNIISKSGTRFFTFSWAAKERRQNKFELCFCFCFCICLSLSLSHAYSDDSGEIVQNSSNKRKPWFIASSSPSKDGSNSR